MQKETKISKKVIFILVVLAILISIFTLNKKEINIAGVIAKNINTYDANDYVKDVFTRRKWKQNITNSI